MHSRRELLLASAAVAAAGIVGCGGGGKSSSVATVSTGQADSEAAILGALLDQEYSSIASYALIAGKVTGPARADALRFLGHERRHAAALAAGIHALGNSASPAKPRSEYETGFPPLRNARDALSFALDVENTAVAAYSDAIGKIVTDSLRATAAAILTTESEHASVALRSLGRPQVPSAFVNGTPPQVSGP
jgi:hypothetical protein